MWMECNGQTTKETIEKFWNRDSNNTQTQSKVKQLIERYQGNMKNGQRIAIKEMKRYKQRTFKNKEDSQIKHSKIEGEE